MQACNVPNLPWLDLSSTVSFPLSCQVMMYLPTPSNRGPLLAKPALSMFPAYLNGTWLATYGSNPPDGGANTLWWLAAMHRYCLYHGDLTMLTSSLLPGLTTLLQHNPLVNGSDGLLHITNCHSPEYPMPASTDCCYDLSIYRCAACV